jgi:uncharacterized protein YgiM (DUF1202 family)
MRNYRITRLACFIFLCFFQFLLIGCNSDTIVKLRTIENEGIELVTDNSNESLPDKEFEAIENEGTVEPDPEAIDELVADNSSDALPDIELETQKIAVVNVDILRLRSGPSTDYEILDRLDYGTRLTVVEQENEWLQVITPKGNEGWVHSDYVFKYEIEKYIFAYDYFDPNTPINISYWEPGSKYWSEHGYDFCWHIGEAYLNGSTRLNEIIEFLGEPESMNESKFWDDSYWITAYYHFITMDFVYSTNSYVPMKKENANIAGISVTSSNVYGPRNIRVGDSLDSLLAKVPNNNNSLKELENKSETAYYEQLLYGSFDEFAPVARIIYSVDKEPLSVEFYDMPFGGFGNGRLVVRIKNNRIFSFSIGMQMS